MKGKKAGLKMAIRLVAIACITATVELLLLNLGEWKMLIDPDLERNREYTLADCTKMNWKTVNGVLQSAGDPMLILDNVGCYVERILIKTELSPDIPYIDLFYTNENYAQYGDVVLRAEKPGSEEIVAIRDRVLDLRIDLGDDPGTELREFSVVVNPAQIQFSIPIVIAVLLIYLTAKFLFSLQKAPDYGLRLEMKTEQTGEGER